MELFKWGGYSFYVKPNSVQSFKGLSIDASCSTSVEENGEEGYLRKTKNGAFGISLTAIIDKRIGAGDVKGYAMQFVAAARTGSEGWVYVNGGKLDVGIMMGTNASIRNIVMAPNGTWISCEVSLSLKQCTRLDGTLTPPPPPPDPPPEEDSGGGDSGGGGESTSYPALKQIVRVVKPARAATPVIHTNNGTFNAKMVRQTK